MFSDEELNRFYRYCIALTGNEADAFDLLQDSLEKFVRRGNRGIENQGGYFFRMIRNQFIDDLRRKRNHDEELYEEDKVIQLDSQSLEDIVMDREQVERVMETLNDQDRELIFLWAVEGFTIQEIADHWEIPKGTLLARIHRLRVKIRETPGGVEKKVTRS
ncbi:MAG: sigma-70 family RNA polymerase sigma factor [Deltaproteobacteria bacterium]|nr:sigma-70 family RNA polymerase sigma factor [Deltaproteobacteria bacterium]